MILSASRHDNLYLKHSAREERLTLDRLQIRRGYLELRVFPEPRRGKDRRAFVGEKEKSVFPSILLIVFVGSRSQNGCSWPWIQFSLLAACRRERTSSHASRSASARVV